MILQYYKIQKIYLIINLMIPIKKEILDKSNEEIINYITNNAKINVNYYPIIAMRTNNNPLFENYLLEQMVKQENFSEKFFGFVKIAWIPFLSFLEYSNNIVSGNDNLFAIK